MDKMQTFPTVQAAVDFILSSERPEGLEVCVSSLPSGTEKRSPKPADVFNVEHVLMKAL